MMKHFKIISLIILCVALSLCACTPNSNESSPPKKDYPSYEYIQPPEFETFEVVTFDFEEWEGENTYLITYSAWLDYNNRVGNSWGYGLEYYGEYIESGSQVSCAKIAKGIIVTVYAIEYDNVTDYGQAYASFDSLDVGEKETKEVAVIVRENRGRYAGSTAQWIFEITVERIS